MLGIADGGAATDAYLVTGGYPRLLVEWRRGRSMWDFVAEQLSDENSDLVVVAQRVLSAEFPVEVQARSVLGAIGAGERTFKGIGGSAGIQATPLSRALRTLRDDKRVVAMDLPVGVRAPDEPRYRVADPYLRFWLRFVEPGIADIARGRPDLAISRIRDSWSEYRGRAVEPIVRQALARLAASDPRLAGAGAVGGYWTRTNDPEIDLVGVDRFPNARRVCFVGSIKWKERAPFNAADLNTLLAVRARLPSGNDAPVIAVSRSPVAAVGLDATFGPGELLSAWS
jgi:AAA+ ATPase superfamily predicted ATPase